LGRQRDPKGRPASGVARIPEKPIKQSAPEGGIEMFRTRSNPRLPSITEQIKYQRWLDKARQQEQAKAKQEPMPVQPVEDAATTQRIVEHEVRCARAINRSTLEPCSCQKRKKGK
jgi:hypothetical protein